MKTNTSPALRRPCVKAINVAILNVNTVEKTEAVLGSVRTKREKVAKTYTQQRRKQASPPPH